jgi:predicted transcriptional regulator
LCITAGEAINIRIGDNLLSWLDAYAEGAEMSRTAVIIQACVEFASRVQGVRTAQVNMDMALLKSFAEHIQIVPGEDGKMSLELCNLGVVHLNGEEIGKEKKS